MDAKPKMLARENVTLPVSRTHNLEAGMAEGFQFDREKFKDVVHFIVDHAVSAYGVENLGNTKLHKILYFSDMLRYLETEQPLTGAEYQRQRFGPTARYLSWGLKELVLEGRVSLSKRDYFGYPKSEYRSLSPPRKDRLSGDEKKLIEHIAAFVCAKTAAEISEFSHDDVWKSVRMGERIPYFAAFALLPAEVSDEDLDETLQEARRIAPLVEAERSSGQVQ